MTEDSDSTSGGQPAARARVLIADDQVEILRALQRELRDLPVDVDSCSSGAEALQALRRERYALLITDYHMPGMTGLELLRQLEAICPETSRIVMSGSADLEQTMKECSQGADSHFIAKPWSRGEMRRQVLQSIEAHRLRIQERGR